MVRERRGDSAHDDHTIFDESFGLCEKGDEWLVAEVRSKARERADVAALLPLPLGKCVSRCS
jgi:hypothetical protein